MFELKSINKKFGKKSILTDINLTVKDGETLCIVGPSGAGKTTLLRIMTGLEKADSGELLLDGKHFEPQNENDESTIGVVFQSFELFPHLNVIENVTLAPKLTLKENSVEADNDAIELLGQLGLNGLEEQYPFQLSGGQKQRVAIARALAMNPKILCYDEPTSALDPNAKHDVAELILTLKQKGMTQIIITHDFEFAESIADKLFEVKANV